MSRPSSFWLASSSSSICLRSCLVRCFSFSSSFLRTAIIGESPRVSGFCQAAWGAFPFYLETTHEPADIRGYTAEQRRALADEMRDALIRRTSCIGGHIGPNLGIIEATIALHTVFDSPHDKIIFDVSHQCYPHKMLTGRAHAYIDEAQYGDVSGFTNTDESTHDIFNIGHTSTAISLASGLAKARDLAGGSENIVVLIGERTGLKRAERGRRRAIGIIDAVSASQTQSV